eukprot:TRINITY_DN14619_c0_g1_i1.p1 TRINITY_DN14619_c0_g1~~TRINITY_DN14619_c0_g1_i1.p1  ORF type:complete len:428 (+),score=55.30 TRINITY_DN14619_c0_g1_i1:161-1444(+)
MLDFYFTFALAAILAGLFGVMQYYSSSSKEALVIAETLPFVSFRNNYLFVYLIMTGADWIQGAYVYALYEHYGFERGDIGLLFVCGFGSSLIFGTFFGSIADKYGRKFSCMLYGVLYGISCITKHFNSFQVLMFGRVLGGIATSILYSAFESWLVYQHNKNGFPGELLSRIFSLAVLGNGIVAIASGVAAYYIKEAWGMVAPFDASLTLLIIGSLVILITWPENYGDATTDMSTSFKKAWNTLLNDRKIILLGLIQSLFEGAMFTFVFMWTPAMQPEDGDPIELPHGLIFATFMVCVMLGSFVFNILNARGKPEHFMRLAFAVSTATFAIPILFTDVSLRYYGFLVFEATVGIFWPALGTMRSKYVPEETRATIMNFFRVPLNAIVVLILVNVGNMQTSTVFSCCFMFMFITCICQQMLYEATRQLE